MMKNRWLVANIMLRFAKVAKADEHRDRIFRLYFARKKIFDDIGAWWGKSYLPFFKHAGIIRPLTRPASGECFSQYETLRVWRPAKQQTYYQEMQTSWIRKRKKK